MQNPSSVTFLRLRFFALIQYLHEQPSSDPNTFYKSSALMLLAQVTDQPFDPALSFL